MKILIREVPQLVSCSLCRLFLVLYLDTSSCCISTPSHRPFLMLYLNPIYLMLYLDPFSCFISSLSHVFSLNPITCFISTLLYFSWIQFLWQREAVQWGGWQGAGGGHLHGCGLLPDMISDKFQVRTTGPIDILTHQPVKGRKRAGGIRFGEMERDSLLAHGSSFLLQDRLLNCSDRSFVSMI